MEKGTNRRQCLRVVHLRSIHEVDEDHWDSINSDSDLFHCHRFIRSVEDARVENSRFWYLLFYHKDRLIATTVLSAFTVSLDLFIGGLAKKLIVGLRRWLPRCMKIKILFCGLPVSLGQRNLVISDPQHCNEVFDLLAREMSAIGHSQRIRFTCVKEFLCSDCEIADRLCDHGFFRANSLPYVSMGMRWPNFGSYLASLRHPYRRAIRRTLKKVHKVQPQMEPHESSTIAPDRPELRIGGPEVCSPEQFFQLYLQVMDRANVKLETLNQPFFENLYANSQNDLEVLVMRKDNDLLGAAILLIYKKTMTFALVGLDYSRRDDYDVYFNIVYGIISRAIQRGCTRLDLGQTSYWLKQRIGGICTPEFFYLKAESRYIHFCLKTLRTWIFPEITLQNPRVFRESR